MSMSLNANVSARAGRSDRGRGGRAFAGGRGFAGRGRGSGYIAGEKAPCDMMVKVTFDTKLLLLKKVFSEYASESHFLF